MTAWRVGDVMSRDVVTCRPNTRLSALASTMASRKIHGIIVVDESRRPVGIVSDVDLLAGEWLATNRINLRTLRESMASELMSAPVETALVADSLEQSIARMRALRVARLPVVDARGVAVGVLSVEDLVARLARPPVRRRYVSDVMSHAILTCRPESPMHAAVRAMVERRSRSVVVIERDRPVGVLTGGDALALWATPSGARGSGTVAEFMTTPVVTALPDLPLHVAADRMLTHEIHRLIVVDAHDGRGPIGVISTSDIVVEMADAASIWQT